jgi:hypothetical protein
MPAANRRNLDSYAVDGCADRLLMSSQDSAFICNQCNTQLGRMFEIAGGDLSGVEWETLES